MRLVYKPFKNQSLCVSKDCVSQKLTLYKYNITQKRTKDTTCGGQETTPFDRRCAFTSIKSRWMITVLLMNMIII